MPGHQGNPLAVLGILVVVFGVKFAAYSWAASLISRAYDRSDLSSSVVGGTRALIGVITGVIYFVLLRYFFPDGSPGLGEFAPGLIPVRLVEWWLLIWLFYDRRLTKPTLGWKVAALGTLLSFVIDFVLSIVAIIVGMIALGGLGV
jgi:hypothetical protein